MRCCATSRSRCRSAPTRASTQPRGCEKLVGLYDAVNIKLDKTGGLTAALQLRDRARELGFSIMVGCMVGTSLGMAPAVLLAQDADFVDLDGPLLLARDRDAGPHLSRFARVAARAGALGLSAAASATSAKPRRARIADHGEKSRRRRTRS